MKILVISDIHANLTALKAVLNDAGDFDATWCLGDVVGYGPDPEECVHRIRSLPNLTCLMGNHDAATLDLIDLDSFNHEARLAVLWTRKQVSNHSLNFLRAQPEATRLNDSVTLAHGSPRAPLWEYILERISAQINFDYFDTPFCFVGHTHQPIIYQQDTPGIRPRAFEMQANSTIALKPRAIINPGSVGQPRDRDPRAAYGILDDQTFEWNFRRVAYDVETVQDRMRALNLPEKHIQRIASGW
ncbi:MAG: metallophosphoesterase family protein [Anaerolineales bacterium]